MEHDLCSSKMAKHATDEANHVSIPLKSIQQDRVNDPRVYKHTHEQSNFPNLLAHTLLMQVLTKKFRLDDT